MVKILEYMISQAAVVILSLLGTAGRFGVKLSFSKFASPLVSGASSHKRPNSQDSLEAVQLVEKLEHCTLHFRITT